MQKDEELAAIQHPVRWNNRHETERKVGEQGEEPLRLARARDEAGTGTQLDVLSAQTASTDARTTRIQALHDYEAARARLERAFGANVPSDPAK